MKKHKPVKNPAKPAIVLDHYLEMQQAIRYAESANWQAAENICRGIVTQNPKHVDAINMLGVVAIKRGQWALAVEMMQKVIHLKPDYLNAYINLGMVMREQGNLEEAARYCRQALKIKPDCAEAYSNLGNALLGMNRAAEAVEAYESALKINPGFWDALNNISIARRTAGLAPRPSAPAVPQPASRNAPNQNPSSNLADSLERLRANLSSQTRNSHFSGSPQLAPSISKTPTDSQDLENEPSRTLQRPSQLAKPQKSSEPPELELAADLHRQGRFAEAEKLLSQILTHEPRHQAALTLLADSLLGLRNYEQAFRILERLVGINPADAAAQCNLASTLLHLERYPEALPHCRKATELAPEMPEAHNNLGLAMSSLRNPEAAIESYRRALDLRPEFPEALDNLATALKELGRNQEAIACLREALRLKPDFAEAHFKLGLILLHLGQLNEGFKEHEWRWQVAKHQLSPPPEPRWDGRPFPGQRLRVHCEQGLGDAIQFVRYLPQLKALGGEVVLGCYPSLLKLFQGIAGADSVVLQDTPHDAADLHVSLMSLPGLFTHDLGEIPGTVPYLKPTPERVEYFARRLSNQPGLKLGLVWSGNPEYRNDAQRSVPLACFAPFAAIPGIVLISLQKGPAAGQLNDASSDLHLIDWSSELSDFADTAGLIANLDLVISVDTSVAHLAGALGKTVWTLLPFPPDWRWLADRDDSPWYPGMRLFRKSHGEGWPEVIGRVKTALDNVLGTAQSDAAPINQPSPTFAAPLRNDLARAAAYYLPAGARILDIGCTQEMTLERFLPDSCQYLPCDLEPYDRRTQVCKLADGELPDIGQATHLVALEILDKVSAPPVFLQHLRASGLPLVLGYQPNDLLELDNLPTPTRSGRFSQAQLGRLLQEAGLNILDGERIGGSLLFRLDGTPNIEVPRPKVLLISPEDSSHFGAQLRRRLLTAILPPGAELTCIGSDRRSLPEGNFDLAVIGTGGDLPLSQIDESLLALSEKARLAIGLFGVSANPHADRSILDRLLDRLFLWCARYQEDVLLYGQGRKNTLHFGDWLIDAFPLTRPGNESTLTIEEPLPAETHPEELIEHIGRFRTVDTASPDHLLCAMCSAETVTYRHDTPSLRFRALLYDIFGRSYPTGEPFIVNRAAIAAYKHRSRLLIEELCKAMAIALGSSLP